MPPTGEQQDKTFEQADAQRKVLQLNVGGMHCVNCGFLVEQRLSQLPQVQRVSVAYPSGHATVTHSGDLDIADLQKAVVDDGYTLSVSDRTRLLAAGIAKNTARDYLEIAAAFAILAGVALVLQQFDLLLGFLEQ